MKKNENTRWFGSQARFWLDRRRTNGEGARQAIICQQGKGPLGAQLHPYPCVVVVVTVVCLSAVKVHIDQSAQPCNGGAIASTERERGRERESIKGANVVEMTTPA